jgi:hypothetical protein
MQKPHDNSKVCRAAFVQDSTLVVVIEMSLTSWLVAGMIPGVDREPLKKIAPDPEELLRLLYRWRDEAIKAGKEITRISVAYETGRDSCCAVSLATAAWPLSQLLQKRMPNGRIVNVNHWCKNGPAPSTG